MAAVSSLVAAPFLAVDDSVKVENKANFAGAGEVAFPGQFVVRAVTKPVKAVAEVGETL